MVRSIRNRRTELRRLVKEWRVGRSSEALVLDVANQLWAALDTPLSLGLSLLARAGQIEDVLKVEFSPSRYLSWKSASDDHQAIAFLKKHPFKGFDRKAPALEKFQQGEEMCRLTNRRVVDQRNRGFDPDLEQVFHSARSKISRWLGDFDASEWAYRCRFGPGADSLNRGMRVSAYNKLSQLSATADFADGARALVCCHPAWQRSLSGLSFLDEGPVGLPAISIAVGNKVTFVPKTALIDRSIAIEPQMNIYAQLGLGACLRVRLSRAGLDLDDQVPNQDLAKEGSVRNNIATMDLSMASDTLAIEVVRFLLPEEWFIPLDWCRSKVGTIGKDGKPFYYEKFSSMGNGFTFELESMIFYALALACSEQVSKPDRRTIRAYGDDIIIPCEAVDLMERSLSTLGFSVNRRKTFSSGRFRESCGADFFDGVNVRPYFQKDPLSNAQSLYQLCNGLRRCAYRRNRGYGCDLQLKRPWTVARSILPKSLRGIIIPATSSPRGDDVETGDGGIVENLDVALSSPDVVRCKDYQVGWLFARVDALSQQFTAENWPALITFGLYECRDGSTEKLSTTHDRISGRGSDSVKLNFRAYSPVWFDLGPWV